MFVVVCNEPQRSTCLTHFFHQQQLFLSDAKTPEGSVWTLGHSGGYRPIRTRCIIAPIASDAMSIVTNDQQAAFLRVFVVLFVLENFVKSLSKYTNCAVSGPH